MDIWEKLYLKAKEQYHPEDVTPFVYAHHVVCALESENGEIFTGFCIESCSGVMNLCCGARCRIEYVCEQRADCCETHDRVP